MTRKRNNKGTNGIVLAASPDLQAGDVPAVSIADARARILANSPSHLLGVKEYVDWVRGLPATDYPKVGVIIRCGSRVEQVYPAASLAIVANRLMEAAAYDLANNSILPFLLAADTANGQVWIVRFKAAGIAFQCEAGDEQEYQPHDVAAQPIILGKEFREEPK